MGTWSSIQRMVSQDEWRVFDLRRPKISKGLCKGPNVLENQPSCTSMWKMSRKMWKGPLTNGSSQCSLNDKEEIHETTLIIFDELVLGTPRQLRPLVRWCFQRFFFISIYFRDLQGFPTFDDRLEPVVGAHPHRHRVPPGGVAPWLEKHTQKDPQDNCQWSISPSPSKRTHLLIKSTDQYWYMWFIALDTQPLELQYCNQCYCSGYW